MPGDGLLEATLGAFQASIAVLLTISYGVLAAQFNLLDGQAATSISKICVRMFLPALLISDVGAELHLETAQRYVPILIWSTVYIVLSLAVGRLGVKLFKFPQWVIPAVCFNNTTSLPLLLIQSLDATGILSTLLKDNESSADAIQRAKSYFLVCAIVGNSLTFALGPRLMDAENVPDDPSMRRKAEEAEEAEEGEENRDYNASTGGESQENEHTSLLPRVVRETHDHLYHHGYVHSKKQWDRLHPNLQWFLEFLADFFNPPLIGALIGALLGLTPALHRSFFNKEDEGGIFNAWLTTPLSNIGKLFATLQTIIVGVTLSSSLRKLKRGEHSGHVPWAATIFIIAIRFVIWPAISIPLIWILAVKTSVMSNDPILWFAMMLMPTGPPAMKLIALSEVNDAGLEEKLATSKLLSIAYALTPLICFTVAGALKASHAAM